MRAPIVAGLLVAISAFPASAADLGAVTGGSFTTHQFHLVNGTVMPRVTIAYETYGKLSPDGRNAVLIEHGFTSSQHAAGRNPTNGNRPGWWNGLIGPGKAIDTNRLYVVSSNMLGSSFGSTNGASLNPATGKPYGPDFPAITVRDMVAAQKALLVSLGVKHLVAVIGPSYGGRLVFQWAVSYPGMMDGVVPVETAPQSNRSEKIIKAIAHLKAQLATDPQWNGGWYYDRGGAKAGLTAWRMTALKHFGIEAVLAPRFPDPAVREAKIHKLAANWARKWDANSLVILLRALVGFNAVPDFPKIKAKVLYVLSRSDPIFPPKTFRAKVIGGLKKAGVDARYVEIDSDFGHLSAFRDQKKLAPALRAFLAPLVARAAQKHRFDHSVAKHADAAKAASR